jgi:hypothetical protein
MSFQPFIAGSGLAGWRFLQATVQDQKAAHRSSFVQQREMDYFRERIGSITSPDELVSDYRLLSVALDAFGLSDQINSRHLIKRVLAEGTTDNGALANKLPDARYRDLSRAFGFGETTPPRTQTPGFADLILNRFAEQSFEVAVGEVDDTMRLALNAQRELPQLGQGTSTNRTKWFTLMGTPPLRRVMEAALGLPESFGAMPIDRQLTQFQTRAEAAFGTSDLQELTRPDKLERILDRFTAIAGAQAAPPTSPALMLLRGF